MRSSGCSARSASVQPWAVSIDVQIRRNDVVVAGEHDRHVASDQLGCVQCQPLKPAQFVIESRAGRRVAVRQIETSHEDAVDRRLDVAAVAVVGIARKPAPRFDRLSAAGEDRDTVPALLAMPDRPIARFTNCRLGKSVLRRLQLLQAGNIRFCFGEPAEQDGQPAVHAIDVESRDLHPPGAL